MPHMRQAEGLYPQIWNLPYLFSESRLPGQAARGDQVQLVITRDGKRGLFKKDTPQKVS